MMNFGMLSGGHMMMGWGGMFFGPLMMIGFLGLIIFTVVMLVKGTTGDSSQFQRSDDIPLNILKERLAAGEIDVREFEEMRSLLA